jgi:hypothetical protein
MSIKPSKRRRADEDDLIGLPASVRFGRFCGSCQILALPTNHTPDNPNWNRCRSHNAQRERAVKKVEPVEGDSAEQEKPAALSPEKPVEIPIQEKQNRRHDGGGDEAKRKVKAGDPGQNEEQYGGRAPSRRGSQVEILRRSAFGEDQT